ncbi:hypothetical protein B0H11DRAFT_1962413 [Mycena galericulata]|nr:hypothetical protein B0H11DRAFT_1962413 [Mycena galericulata]
MRSERSQNLTLPTCYFESTVTGSPPTGGTQLAGSWQEDPDQIPVLNSLPDLSGMPFYAAKRRSAVNPPAILTVARVPFVRDAPLRGCESRNVLDNGRRHEKGFLAHYRKVPNPGFGGTVNAALVSPPFPAAGVRELKVGEFSVTVTLEKCLFRASQKRI